MKQCTNGIKDGYLRADAAKSSGIILIAVFFVLAGCAGGAKEVKKEIESKYRKEVYLTAEGIGRSEMEARNRALAEMSRIFEARIISETVDRVKSVLDASGTVTSEQKVESNIKVVSEVGLKGVEIVKTWKEGNEYYALATLDRQISGDDWLFDVTEIDRKINSYLNLINSTRSNYAKLRALNEITALWLEREAVVSRLRVVGFEVEPGGYDMKNVFSLLHEIKSTMPVFIDIGGASGENFAKDISEALGAAGLSVSDNRDKAEIIIAGSTDAKPVDLGQPGVNFARISVSLRISEVKTGLTVGEVTEDARAGHLNYDEALRRAFKKASSVATENVINYFEGPMPIRKAKSR